MTDKPFEEIVELSGLRHDVVGDLLDKGWTFVTADGEGSIWVSPTAGLPDYIPHKEPVCDNICGNMAPHYHGLPCHRDCPTCDAVCHPDCPAYISKE